MSIQEQKPHKLLNVYKETVGTMRLEYLSWPEYVILPHYVLFKLLIKSIQLGDDVHENVEFMRVLNDQLLHGSPDVEIEDAPILSRETGLFPPGYSIGGNPDALRDIVTKVMVMGVYGELTGWMGIYHAGGD